MNPNPYGGAAKEEEPVSLTDLGFQRKTSTVVTAIGKIRHWQNIRRNEWIFLAISLLSTIVSLGMTIERMVVVPGGSPDLTYAILLAINTVFCLYYIIHGVFQEQVYEILVFTATTVIVMIYIIINYVEGVKGNVKLGRLILMSILGPINIGLGAYLSWNYWKSNNLIFRIVGGAEEMQRICRIFFLCGGFLIFDLQFQLSIIVLTLKTGMIVTTAETVIISAGSVFAFAWWMIGFAALREEAKYLVWIFWALSPVTPAYVIFKFVNTVEEMTDANILYEVTFCVGGLFFIIRICLVVTMFLAYSNFGKGYREKSFGMPEREDQIQNDVRRITDSISEPC